MDDLRLHAVVARVVAWHNQHPLARRITAEQVNSVGYVSVPYTAPGMRPPSAPVSPAPPPAAVPVPLPDEPTDIDPVIETEDPGAIVIDVDPESQGSAGSGADADADADADTDVATATATAGPSPAAVAAHTAPAGSSLRARALSAEGASALPAGAVPGPVPQAARPSPGAPRTLVCSEDFLAPEPVDKVLDWVRRHGLALADEPVDGPVHQVPVDAALLPAGAGVAQLWVATAAIEIGGRRHRLLLGGGDQPAVLGRRVPSRPRLAGAAAAPCLLLSAAVWLMWPAAAGPTVALAAATEPAASAALAVAGLPVAASAAESGASAVAVAVGVDSGPDGASADPPRLPGLLDDDAKARARAAVAAVRAERHGPAPASSAAAVSSPAAPPAAPAAKPAPPPAVLFGLSTRPLRTRAEAEQLQAAFQALLGGAPGSPLRVEMLPAGEDWRVVCWPYERRADAARARALLQARGLSVELVDF
jgi:hypothetical protein